MRVCGSPVSKTAANLMQQSIDAIQHNIDSGVLIPETTLLEEAQMSMRNPRPATIVE